MKTTEQNTIKRSLICTLSDEERRNYGIKLATTLDDIEKVEEEKKRTVDHYKERIAGLNASAVDLRHRVSTGQEWRDVECIVKYCEPDKAHKQIIRNDTGEVVATEIMTESDKQLKLPKIDDDETDGEGNDQGGGEEE